MATVLVPVTAVMGFATGGTTIPIPGITTRILRTTIPTLQITTRIARITIPTPRTTTRILRITIPIPQTTIPILVGSGDLSDRKRDCSATGSKITVTAGV